MNGNLDLVSRDPHRVRPDRKPGVVKIAAVGQIKPPAMCQTDHGPVDDNPVIQRERLVRTRVVDRVIPSIDKKQRDRPSRDHDRNADPFRELSNTGHRLIRPELVRQRRTPCSTRQGRFLFVMPREKTRFEIREARFERRKAKGERRKAKGERRKAKGEIRDSRFERRDSRGEIPKARSNNELRNGGSVFRLSNLVSRISNPESRIPNPVSRISSLESRLSNLESHLSFDPLKKETAPVRPDIRFFRSS